MFKQLLILTVCVGVVLANNNNDELDDSEQVGEQQADFRTQVKPILSNLGGHLKNLARSGVSGANMAFQETKPALGQFGGNLVHLARSGVSGANLAFQEAKPALGQIGGDLMETYQVVSNHPNVRRAYNKVSPHIESVRVHAEPYVKRAEPYVRSGAERVKGLLSRVATFRGHSPSEAPLESIPEATVPAGTQQE